MTLSRRCTRRLRARSRQTFLLPGFLWAVVAFALSGAAVGSGTEGDVQGDDLDRRLARLEPLTFHPNLLPVILRNVDMIGLTTAQVDRLRAWRREHARSMVAAMQQVAEARILFQTAALASTTSSDALRTFQDQIFAMQRKVLDYKLACRDNIMGTFTEQNWENLYLVLATEGINVPLPAYGEVVATLPGDH